MNSAWGNIIDISYYYRSLGMYGYDDKKVVRNPIDEDHFAGGSSSGSAAAVKSY